MNDSPLSKKNNFFYGEESVSAWLEITSKQGSLIRSFCPEDTHTPFTHYPSNDFTSGNKLIQYYYHSHRDSAEHGHIHVFLKNNTSSELIHYIAIGLTSKGLPISFFTVDPSTVDEPTFTSSEEIIFTAQKAISLNKNDTILTKWLVFFLLFYKDKVHGALTERESASDQTSVIKSTEMHSMLNINWEKDLNESEENHNQIAHLAQAMQTRNK